MWILLISMMAADGSVTQQEYLMDNQPQCEQAKIVNQSAFAMFHPVAKCIFDKSLKK